jgi:hypothetical protein
MGHFSRRTTPANTSNTASADGEAIGHALTATLGNTIDLMDQTRQGPPIVQAGESLNVSGQHVDFAGDPILKAGLIAFLLTPMPAALVWIKRFPFVAYLPPNPLAGES